jgi:UDP-N-acetylmuramyl pentapeptide phosphotransferase/UDP-N-acetylglucosamine-1-phosphate transferase
MGDTGSLLLGLVCAILAIEFIELNNSNADIWMFQSAPAAAIGVMILPLFDTLLVFTKRIIKGKSPFHPDKTHIHHLCLNLGMSHVQATILLVCVNILFILFVYFFDHLGNVSLISSVLAIALFLSSILHFLNRRKIQSENRTT